MDGLELMFTLIILIMFGPPLLFTIIGLVRRKSNAKAAKVFYILAAVWLIVGGGICASLMAGF